MRLLDTTFPEVALAVLSPVFHLAHKVELILTDRQCAAQSVCPVRGHYQRALEAWKTPYEECQKKRG